MWEVARIRGSRASESTSGVEREPGEVHASRRPQRASSSTKARRPRYVSVAGIVCGVVPARPRPPPRLHADRRELGRGGARAGGTLPRAGPRPGRRAVGGGARPPRGARCRPPSRSPATRWAGGSRWRSRCGSRSGSSGSCWSPRAPGSPTPAERAARRAADEALADRIEAIGVEAFAREWAAQPLFAGQPPEVAAAAHADRLRRSAAEHAAQLRGLGTGVDAAAVGPARRADDAGDARWSASATRSSARSRSAWASRSSVVPGAGHAVPPRGARRRRRAPRGALNPWRRAGSGVTLAAMLRTSRTYRRGRAGADLAGRVAPAAARAPCRAERARGRARGCGWSATTSQHMPWRRQEALEAERRRWAGLGTPSLRRVPWRFSDDVEPYAERVRPAAERRTRRPARSR